MWQEFKERIHPSWHDVLTSQWSTRHMCQLASFLETEWAGKIPVYPDKNQLFSAFMLTPLDDIRVVILGQDPYHGPGQAHGLSFSISGDGRLPPSLMNIFKELESDLGIPAGNFGNLSPWARQGVFLLNTVLSVRKGAAGSHRGKGWESFTDFVIHCVSQRLDHVAFVLWGSQAQEKASLIDSGKHLILKSPHPSPLSAYRGFFGSKPFSQCNDFLRRQNMTPIDWRLS